MPGLKLCGATSLALKSRYDCPITGMSHCAYGAMICKGKSHLRLGSAIDSCHSITHRKSIHLAQQEGRSAEKLLANSPLPTCSQVPRLGGGARAPDTPQPEGNSRWHSLVARHGCRPTSVRESDFHFCIGLLPGVPGSPAALLSTCRRRPAGMSRDA